MAEKKVTNEDLFNALIVLDQKINFIYKVMESLKEQLPEDKPEEDKPEEK